MDGKGNTRNLEPIYTTLLERARWNNDVCSVLRDDACLVLEQIAASLHVSQKRTTSSYEDGGMAAAKLREAQRNFTKISKVTKVCFRLSHRVP